MDDNKLKDHLDAKDTTDSMHHAALAALVDEKQSIQHEIDGVDSQLRNFDLVDLLETTKFETLSFELFHEIFAGLRDAVAFFELHNVSDYLSRAHSLQREYKGLLLKRLSKTMLHSHSALFGERVFLDLTEPEIMQVGVRYLRVRKLRLMESVMSLQRNFECFLPQCLKQEIYVYHKIFKGHMEEFINDINQLMHGKHASGIFCCFVYSFLKGVFTDLKGVSALSFESKLVQKTYDVVPIDSMADQDILNLSHLLIARSLFEFSFSDDSQIVEL